MRTKFTNEPQSPIPAGQRPFSYGANIMSPKLKHVDLNGQAKQSANMPRNQNEQFIRYDEIAMSYGKNESAFSPQPKMPAPVGPPPPAPPPSGYNQAPPLPPSTGRAGLPNLRMQQRHSVTTLDEGASNKPRSPVSAQRERFSKRSKSVPCNPEDEVNLPSPPPPVSVKDSYLAVAIATNRPPSPPLPPPPPEMMLPSREESQPPPPPSNVPYNQKQTSYSQQQQYNQQQQFNQHQRHNQQQIQYGGQNVTQVHSGYPVAGTQPPPPPPVSSIPKKSNEQGTSAAPKGGNSVPPQQFKENNSVLPPKKDIGRAKRDQSPGMLDELSRVQLKRTGNFEILCMLGYLAELYAVCENGHICCDFLF